jgi:hypothetical protein
MKNKLVIIMLLTIIIFTTVCKSYAQDGKLLSVKIEYESFLTESFDNVDCTSFRTAFGNTIHQVVLNRKSCLNEFNQLNELFIKKSRNMDVRGVITFNYKKNKIAYCFDSHGYFEKDGITFYNKKLIDFLNSKLHLWQ